MIPARALTMLCAALVISFALGSPRVMAQVPEATKCTTCPCRAPTVRHHWRPKSCPAPAQPEQHPVLWLIPTQSEQPAVVDPPVPTVSLQCTDRETAAQALDRTAGQHLWADKLGLLVAGVRLDQDWSLLEARKAYEGAMSSTNAQVANCAEALFHGVAQEQSGWAWHLSWFPPVRWFKESPLRALLYLLVPLGMAVLIGITWVRSIRRGIYLSAPRSIGGEVPVELFAAEVCRAMTDVKQLIQEQAQRHQMRGSAALSLSNSELPKDAIGALPSVLGVDVGKLIPALLYLYRYFFVRLECSLASSGEEVSCYSSLHRGCRTLARWHIRVPLQPLVGAKRIPLDEILLVARRVAYLAAAMRVDPALRAH